MVLSHFGLTREPFSLAPDPRFLFMSERHREALAHLLYGVRGGGGFVVLTGEIGAGKTTLARGFLEQLPAHCVVAYVFNPILSRIELLQTVADEFGLPPLPAELRGSVKAHVDALNRFLLQVHAEGRQALLIIDEAQALKASLLEQLRLLTNLETNERKLLQIVLIGQPELRERLAEPGLEQLAQRVIARYHLGALTLAETEQYVEHRLAVAGLRGAPPFKPAALRALQRFSGGVPRRINLLAERALLGAYGRGLRVVDQALVGEAAAEVLDRRVPPGTAPRRVWAAAALSLGVVGLLAGAWWWQQASPSASPAMALAPAAASAPAAAAASSAAAVQAAAASAWAPPPADEDPRALLAAAVADEAQALRELALRWNVAIGDGEPCLAARQAELACFRSPRGGLAQLRTLARPAVLVLQAGDGQRRHAVLVALGEEQATLQVGTQRFTLGLPALAAVWRGEFTTLWRTPPRWQPGPEGQAAVRAWAGPLLARLVPAAAADDLVGQVSAFQLLHGLPVDGQPGPLTLMLLSRAHGVVEPSLDMPER